MPGVLQEDTPGLAGCIKWLPPKDRLAEADSGIEEGCCNHPVVILPTKISENGEVEILIITSFGGSDLATRFPHQTNLRHEHLPIAPSEAHPDNGIQLTLRDPLREMRKRSYVKTKNRQRVRFASLQPYDRHGPDYYLSRRSFEVLVEHALLSEYNLPRVLLPPPTPSIVRVGPILAPPSIATTVTNSRRTSLDTERSPTFQWGRPSGLIFDEADDISSYQIRVQTARQARSAYHAEPNASRYGRQQQQQQRPSETQPLLGAANQRDLMRLYGRQGRSSTTTTTPTAILPTSHQQVHSSYVYERGSEPFPWGKVWTCVKVLLWICVFLGFSYGTYRAGVWVAEMVARMVNWTHDTFVSMGVKIGSLWSAFRKAVHLD